MFMTVLTSMANAFSEDRLSKALQTVDSLCFKLSKYSFKHGNTISNLSPSDRHAGLLLLYLNFDEFVYFAFESQRYSLSDIYL